MSALRRVLEDRMFHVDLHLDGLLLYGLAEISIRLLDVAQVPQQFASLLQSVSLCCIHFNFRHVLPPKWAKNACIVGNLRDIFWLFSSLSL
jgi:hypothetical protein